MKTFHIPTPGDIEGRAGALGVSMRRVLLAANVYPAQWHDWKNGKTAPLISTVQKLIDALDKLSE